MNQRVTALLRSEAAEMEPDEVLRAPTAMLMGVSAAAQSALTAINIRSVFDLAAARVFAGATRLLEIGRDPNAVEARLDAVAGDVADVPPGVPVRDLVNQPIGVLRDIGPANAATLSNALDVGTVRDLALWPPYRAAKEILKVAFYPEQVEGFDPEAPPDLLPATGNYPTERVFFRKLVMDSVPNPGEGAQPIEDADALDLAATMAAADGFTRLATGALLTFSQSWYSQGVTLGQLLHSMSLAPGESTRVAVVDWSRRSRAAASEDISESELLSNTMTHSRSLSEVTNATATEFQSGKSSTRSESTTGQAGGGFGLDLGPLAIGGSGGVSNTTTEVMSASSSFGARELAAEYAQQINDRSQQNASSVRNRRASIVREVSQTEHEAISTRVVTNYNHMHALSISYYEVVQAFRTTTQLERAERCLFVPVRIVDFRDHATIDRWRLALADAALTARVRRQLTVEYGVVEIVPQTPRVTPGMVIAGHVAELRTTGVLSRRRLSTGAAPAAAAAPSAQPADAPTDAGTEETEPPAVDYRRAPANSPAALLTVKGWDLDQLNRIGWATGRPSAQPDSDSVFVSDDALVIGLSLREGQAARFVVRLRDGRTVEPASASATDVAFAVPVAIVELDSIAVQYAGESILRTSLVLQLMLSGTVLPLSVPVELRPMSQPKDVIKFGGAGAAGELVAHLEANRLHYTQAILRTLDVAMIGALLARYTYRGLPLIQLVDSQPVAVVANTLVFKLSISADGESDDPRWGEEQAAWKDWLSRHGLDRPVPRSETIPLPSGGVFAEAVLGRYNAAEKVDLTRFWNWQDSPIPITAPEIAAVQAGSRAQSDEIRPGQLSAPVLSIQSPTALPDPTGVAAIISAVQNGNMFRDMSGMVQTAALAQAALQASAQGATAVGEQAGQNLATVMSNHTERMRIAAQLLSAAAGVPSIGGAGGATPPPGKGTVSERGGELNTARALDAERSAAEPGPQGEPMRMTDIPPTEFAADTSGASSSMQPRTITEDIFRRQASGPTGGIVGDGILKLVNAVAEEDETGATGGGGGGSTAPSARRLQVTTQFWIHSTAFVPDPPRRNGEMNDQEIAVRIWDGRGNRLLWPSKRKLGVYYEAKLINGLITGPMMTGIESDEVAVMAVVRYGGAGGKIYSKAVAYKLPAGDSLDLTVYVTYTSTSVVVKAANETAAVTKARKTLRDKYAITNKMIFGSLIKFMEDDPGWFTVDLDHYTGEMRFAPKPLVSLSGGGG
jgi:hypothetical protein